MPTPQRWCLVVPVKRLELAKTRLTGDVDARVALALAFAADTVSAALVVPEVAAVVVVTDDAVAATALRRLGADVIDDVPDAGLNPALRHGAAHAARLHPGHGIGALSADLPALRPAELGRALQRALAHGIAVVPDVAGTGTTAYFVGPGTEFAPAFGADSLRAHAAAGAAVLADDDLESVRRDVDTRADLEQAIELGLGPHTTAVLAEVRSARCGS